MTNFNSNFDLPSTGTDPYDLFGQWFRDAKEAEINDPEAMSLATVADNGRPSIRTVLMKAYDERGFVFFTNAQSRKGQQLLATHVAALCFHWKSLGRQVHIEGVVEKISEAESDTYFKTRPRGSQIGAWASQQSQPLEDRETLLARVDVFEDLYKDKPVPRPLHWRGFRVVPDRIEFWQAGEFRIHDRFAFTQKGDAWTATRLNP